MAITKISSGVIGLNAVTATIVAENVITTSEIATNGVGTLQIANDAVTSAKLDTNIDVAGTLDVTGVLTADSNVVIAGNLTVNGSTVTNSSTNTTIEDALIELGTGTSGTPANDAGIVIERGSAANAFMGYDESADKFIVATTTATGSSTGNLSLTAAPLVTGALTASGLAYPTSDGTANQVLSTDGSGALSFTTVATGGAIVEKYTATGNGSTTAFDTGINPQDEVNSWVHIDGVYQNKSEYSFSGTTITFTAAPESGALIEIIIGKQGGFSTADSVLGVYSATTSNTASYDTGLSATSENNVNVYVDGVYQPKSSFSWSGTTLTLDAIPPTGLALEVVASKTLTAGAVVTASIADDAVTAAKLASNAVVSASIVNNSIVGADISATTNITANAFTGALTGNVTGNVTGNLTGTVLTAAQTNITSLGTLTALTGGTGDLNWDSGTLFVDSSADKVGIGTTSPDLKLDVSHGTAAQYIATFQNTANNNKLKIGNQAQGYLNIQGARIDNGNAYNFSLQADGGNVGIGTTTPSSILEISKAGEARLKVTSTNNNWAGLDLEAHGNQSNYIFFRDNGAERARIQVADGNEMIFSNGSSPAERMRIDSAGDARFAANATGAALIKGVSGNQTDRNTGGYPQFTFVGNEGTGMRRVSSNVLAFDNSGAESMRIDSSGNLLVGITSTTVGAGGSGVTGFRVDGSSGIVQAAGSGTIAAIFNRTTNDGDIVSLRKNGTEVGSIGTEGTELTLGSNGAGLQFLGSENKIRPFNMDSNSASNGVVDLGRSNAKFKDIYLSGNVRVDAGQGILFGGAAGASGMTSQVLDDYEEGTWTPTFVGATLAAAEGWYTKIGNQVTVHFYLVTTGGLPSSGTQVRVGALPYTVTSSFAGAGSLYVGPSNVSSATGGGGTIVSFVSGNEAFIRFVNVDTGVLGYTLMGELEVSANNSITALGTITYQA